MGDAIEGCVVGFGFEGERVGRVVGWTFWIAARGLWRGDCGGCMWFSVEHG